MAVEKKKPPVHEKPEVATTIQYSAHGEPISEIRGDVFIIPKSKKKARGWVMLFEESFKEISQKLTKNKQLIALGLLNEIVTEIEPDTGLFNFHAKEFSDRLGCSVSAVYKAIQTLQEMRIVREVKKSGSYYTYTINPVIVWKGSIALRDAKILKFNETV